MTPSNNTTLADIAAQAGVSKSTVSLALRGDKRITEATRIRVIQTANDLNYRPDPLVARLAARRWKATRHTTNVALIFNKPIYNPTNPEQGRDHALLIDGINNTAKLLGYDVEQFALKDRPIDKSLLRTLLVRNVKGIIICRIVDSKPLMTLDWSGFSVVRCLASTTLSIPFDHIDGNPFESVASAYKIALEKGYKRIAFATFDEPESQDERMRQAAYTFFSSLNPIDAKVPIFRALPSKTKTDHFSEQPFIDWIKRHRPDCLIGMNGIFSWWLQKNGYYQPRDIGFIALIDSSERLNLSRFEINYEKIGQLAMKTLDSSIRMNQCGPVDFPKSIFIDPIWRSGSTLRT